MLCPLTGLSATRRLNSVPIELEAKAATWPLWGPRASEPTGKEESD